MNGQYAIDECSAKDRKTIIDKLEELDDHGMIEYNMVDKWTIEIQDIDMDDSTITELKELFHEFNVFEITDIINNDDEESDWGEDWD
jgi:hypothetical protein